MKKFTILILSLFLTFNIYSQIFTESFETVWSPNPTGWFQEEVQSGYGNGDNVSFIQATYNEIWMPSGQGSPSNPQNGSSVAYYNCFVAMPGQVDRLFTGNIDLSATINPKLTFYLYFEGGQGDLDLVASYDGGLSWFYIQDLEATNGQWKLYNVFIPDEYKVANMRFGFEVYTDFSLNDIYIDNVTLFDTPTELSGTKTINNLSPTSGDNYNSFTDAINALNLSGVGVSGVTFLVSEGQTFSENLPVISNLGSYSNTIVFKNSAVPGINNPSIQPTGVGANDYVVKIYESDYITFDGIDVICKSSNIDAVSRLEYGYLISDNSSNNVIKNCTIDLNKNNTNFSIGISTINGGCNYNSFLSNLVTDCNGGYYVSGLNDINTDYNNTIGIVDMSASYINNIGGSHSESVYGVKFAYQENFDISNTTFENISGDNSSVYGIYCSAGINSSSDIYYNLISDLIFNGSLNSTAAAINLSAGSHSISSNEINGITNSSNLACGILGNTIGALQIFKNNIHNISYTGNSFSSAHGINISSSAISTNVLYNNVIYDLKAPDAETSWDYISNACGLFLRSGMFSIYYNSVLINYEANNEHNISSAIFANGYNALYDIRNNIFENKSTGVDSLAVAFFYDNEGTAGISPQSNNNLYYAGIPSESNIIFSSRYSRIQTMPEYKTYAQTFDSQSFSEDVPFLSSVEPYNLRANTTIPTVIESSAQPITNIIYIDDDFEGNYRDEFTPDMGAFEGNYTPKDIIAPYISYDIIENTISLEQPVLIAEITDDSGVNATDFKPRLYFKKTTDGDYFGSNNSTEMGWKYVETSSTSSPFSFEMDFTLLYNELGGEGEVYINDIIEYFVVSQDISDLNNISAMPSEGFVANSMNDIISSPSNPNYYFIASLHYNFEASDDQGFYHEAEIDYLVDEWERGTPTGGDYYPETLPSGTNCWATNLEANYSVSASYNLYSAVLVATENQIIIDFSEYLAVEGDSDFVAIEYSINDLVWIPLDEYSFYLPEWQHKIYQFPAVIGNNVKLRWKFNSNHNDSTLAGWFIDDLLVRGASVTKFANFTVTDIYYNVIQYPIITIEGQPLPVIGGADGKKSVQLASGSYNFSVASPIGGYEPYSNSFEIFSDDVDVEVLLIPVSSTRTATFQVNDADNNQPLQGAVINLGLQVYYTGVTGEIVINNLLPVSYNYTVSKNGYVANTGNQIDLTEGNQSVYILLEKSTDIDELNSSLSVYPNPTDGNFIINSEITDNIVIEDIAGKQILVQSINSGINSFNLSGFSKGIYIIRFANSNKEVKIIVQ